jgi:6-phosphogluconolactonase (cycloisomerase 2 family)
MPTFVVYVGTYTLTVPTPRSQGIFIYQLDATTGKLTFVGSVADIVNPSFLSIYAIDQSTGHLMSIGFIPTQGRTPRNFAFHPTVNSASHSFLIGITNRLGVCDAILHPFGLGQIAQQMRTQI